MNIWIRRLLILLTVGGGFCGVVVISTVFAQTDGRMANSILLLGMIAVFAFGVFCGLRFIENEREGLRWLPWFFGMQIPIISSPIITYHLGIGLAVNLSLVGAKMSIFFRYGSEIGVWLFQDRPWGIGINAFALAMFIWTRRKLKQIEGSAAGSMPEGEGGITPPVPSASESAPASFNPAN